MATARKSARRRGDATTIDEVAARAGVSPMTVSRVINGKGHVRDTTRERVMRVIQELDYTPNLAASSLAAAQTTRIALIHTNPSGAYLRELLVGALQGAARTATQLVVDAWDEVDEQAEQRAARALARSVAGVILPPPLCESPVVIGELLAAKIPVVAIASGHDGEEISRVRIDDFSAAREITGYLIARGHRHIAFVSGDPNQTASARRHEGWLAALLAAGIVPGDDWVQPGAFTYRSGLQAAERLLAGPVRPTAIFASNDDMAAAVVSVAHRQGLDVPRDLSVVGFDDSSAATTVWPELTTVRQPIAAMADSAVEILMRDIRRQDPQGGRTVDQIVAHELVERGSVARPVGG
ncbi:MAG TPA: LacI family DNA-binding transcriptional regulator [Stenotrophomonas sp.]